MAPIHFLKENCFAVHKPKRFILEQTGATCAVTAEKHENKNKKTAASKDLFTSKKS